MSPLRKTSFCQTQCWMQILKYSFTTSAMRHAHCVCKIHIRLDFDKNRLLGVDSIIKFQKSLELDTREKRQIILYSRI